MISNVRPATARSMVMKYGMSEKLGLITYGDDDDEVFIGRDLAHTRSYSEEVAREIDEEIRIISECHEMQRRLFLGAYGCSSQVCSTSSREGKDSS